MFSIFAFVISCTLGCIISDTYFQAPASLGWGRRLVKGNIDEWAPVTFCDTSQQNQFQNKFWPRLRAFPGANISVDYTLSPGVSSERAGHITLFGSNNAGFPDTRNFQSFLPLDSTITGSWHTSTYRHLCGSMWISCRSYKNSYAELVNIPYEDAISTRRTTFQIATNAGSSSRYTMYWMWNTTVSISDAWVVS